jgi:hydrogenase maturation protein HypF
MDRGRYSSTALAYAAADAFACGVADVAIRAAAKTGIDLVGLSGGVVYNDHIVWRIRQVVEDSGYTSHRHKPELF